MHPRLGGKTRALRPLIRRILGQPIDHRIELSPDQELGKVVDPSRDDSGGKAPAAQFLIEHPLETGDPPARRQLEPQSLDQDSIPIALRAHGGFRPVEVETGLVESAHVPCSLCREIPI